MATTRHRDFKKPLKWFEIGSCFRYEEPQEGRSREFIQFNADILGDNSPSSDAELIAMSIDVMLAFGLKYGDFAIRLSNREVWTQFLNERNVPAEHGPAFLQIIDKIERAKPEDTAKKLSDIGLALDDVRAFMAAADENHPAFAALRTDLTARGLWQYVRIDASIVRGLAYYTGTVFEVFDLKHGLRAVAGGGRYDKLCALMSNGAVDMPAAGFAMGDVVLGILLSKTPGAQFSLTKYLNEQCGVDAFIVVADDTQSGNALRTLQQLRDAGVRADHSFGAQKVNKQFQAAENQKARFAIVFGAEYPQLVVKNLISRQQQLVSVDEIVPHVQAALAEPETGPLLA